MKLFQLCIANGSLISDQSAEEIVDDCLESNQTFETLESAMQAANEEMQYMDEAIEIASWKKTENIGMVYWDNEVGGIQYRIWEIKLQYLYDTVELGKAAIPINDDDWGTERQIDAENKFMEQAGKRMSLRQMEDFEIYAHKAGTLEWVNYALQILGEDIPKELELPKPVYSGI